MRITLQSVIILSFTLYSCDLFQSQNETQSSDKRVASLDEYEYLDSHSSDYIYDQDKLHKFEIFIDSDDLEEINNDPALEKYVNAHLVFENKVVKDVGIRYKGSIGAWVGCLSNNDWTNPSGYKICPKLSMKIKFNFNEEKQFYGLKKLQLHSQNLDPSKMRERLGYYMYRNFGVVAPRSNHALVYINDVFSGVYANTENIDGPFTNKHFDDIGGNLYKEVWPIKSNGSKQEEVNFKNALKTNEEASDVSKIFAFSEALSETNNSATNELIDSWIDKDIFLKTLVVDRRIAHDDGFLHFYHQGGDIYESHNYYWYENPSNNKIQLIPWDLDNAFENLNKNINPVTPIKDKWYEITNDCNGFPFGTFGLLQKSAACDKIIGAFIRHKDYFYTLDNDFQNELFNNDHIVSLLNKWADQINDAVIDANSLYGSAEPSYEEWILNLNFLIDSIRLSLQ